MYFVVIYSLQPLFVVLLPRRTSGHFYSHVNLSGIHVPLKYLCINAKITYLNLCCEKDPQIWTRRVSFLLWRAAGSRIPSQFTPSHFKQHQYSVASAVFALPSSENKGDFLSVTLPDTLPRVFRNTSFRPNHDFSLPDKKMSVKLRSLSLNNLIFITEYYAKFKNSEKSHTTG